MWHRPAVALTALLMFALGVLGSALIAHAMLPASDTVGPPPWIDLTLMSTAEGLACVAALIAMLWTGGSARWRLAACLPAPLTCAVWIVSWHVWIDGMPHGVALG